ncbi:MAG: LVIVD repeat-containing protein [Actinomycetota bacterium]
MPKIRFATFGLVAAALIAVGLPAGAGHTTDPRTNNLHPMGHIEEPASLLNPAVGNINIHTDIAFWGKLAFQGTWNGFNIRDVTAPGNPKHVSFTSCLGPQGDVVVWGDILVRTWDVPAGTAGPFGAGLVCDGQPVPAGFEGVHVFDITDVSDPELVASVNLSAGSPAASCGTHTATAVPDPENDRLLVYSSNSNTPCPWFDIVEVPLDNPAGAAWLRREPSDHTCHDIGVILGDVMKAACAGGEGVRVFSLEGGGASLEDPQLLFHVEEPGVTVGHSAAWSWDGEVIVFGHEPGGGVAPRCQATSAPVDRTMFFYDGDTGAKLGQWTLPRTQSGTENCTIHNYNVVPLRSGRYVVVHGSYQSGTSVVDFTDPANAVELAFSDPPPIVPTDLGGAWSSYWYNNFIHETNITEGLNIFRFSGSQTAGAMRLGHLNPQTQEFSL